MINGKKQTKGFDCLMLTEIILPLIIGLCMFMFGMKLMELALHYWAGPYLKATLTRFTKTPWRGMLTGTGLTALLQSSSAISVITIGLVNAGILTFPQTLGIILGTNIGTVITTELIGLSLNKLALPMLFSAVSAWFISWLVPSGDRNSRIISPALLRAIRCLAVSVIGFSCILLGMEVMQTIVPALQSRGLFAWFLEQSQRSLLWGIVAGAGLTAIVHSSSVTIAMTMGLASVEAIPVELGIAIILGANIGTCSTAFIASIGGTKYGQYVAWFHILLNAVGALLFFPLISQLHEISALFSSAPAGKLAHAQTIFNIACSLIALPFCYLPFLRKVGANATRQ
jgi:phosphate:Na+ symporter